MNNHRSFVILLISSLLVYGCNKISKAPPQPDFPTTETNQTILETQKAMGDSLNITTSLEVFVGKTETPNFKDTNGQENKLWLKYDGTVYAELSTANEGICWFRLTMRNTTPDIYKRLLCFSDLDRVEFYYSSEKIERGGELVPLRDWSYVSNNHCLTLRLDSYQPKTFFIKCYKQGSGINHPLKFIVRSEQNERSFQSFEIRSRMVDTVFLFFYLGFLSFCFIYFLAQFLFNLNEKILLVYSLYIFFTLLYSFRDIDKHYFLQTAFPAFNGINIWGEAIFSYLSYIFYLLFVIYLLDLKKERKWAYRLVTTGIIVMTLLLFTDIILRLSGNDVTALTIFRTSRMLLFPLIIIYFALIPFRGSYYKYFLIGSVFLVLGAGINLLISPLRNSSTFIFHDAISSYYGFWGNPVNYSRMGIIVEVLFFSLGLAKKMRMAFAEAALREDSAIENRFHIHEVNSSLTTLRSKLGNEQEAEAYLALFNKYLRTALELMKYKDGIALTKEIEMARAYFKLRQEDDERFTFYFDDNNISTDSIFIPAGLLIPFIQNFFQHAVTSGSEHYKFDLLLYKEGKKINLNITDNGKGIDTAAIYNKSGSSGLDIARRKINLFNSLIGTKLDFTIGNNKTARGTLITIINLPKKYVK